METNIDFKKIWHKQKVDTPNVEILYDKVNIVKRESFYKLILINVAVVLIAIFIGFIWYYYQPEFITTKIGIILTFLAMVIFVIPFNKQVSLLTKTQTEPNNKEYLKELTRLKEMQVFQQTKILSLYFILLSLGIGLYLFEHVSKMTITLGIVVYSLTLIWFIINWFYLRPRAIKKQNKKINKLLIEFQRLTNQIKTIEKS